MFVEKTLTKCPLCNRELFSQPSPLLNKLVAFTEQTGVAALLMRVSEIAILIIEGLVFGGNCDCGNFHILSPLTGLVMAIGTFILLRHSLDPEKYDLQDKPMTANATKLARLAAHITYAACCSTWVKSQWQDTMQRRQGEISGW